MNDKYSQFVLRFSSETNWTIIGRSNEWYIHNFFIRRKGNSFYSGRKDKDGTEEFKIDFNEILITVYNYWIVAWDEQDQKDFQANIRRKGRNKAESIKEALEINSSAMRQLYLNVFWADVTQRRQIN